MQHQYSEEQLLQLAEKIRQTCLEAARDGFRDASMSGLCSEGASEAATSAIQNLNLKKLVKEVSKNM